MTFREALDKAIKLAPDSETRRKLVAAHGIPTPRIERGDENSYDVLIGDWYIVSLKADGTLYRYEDIGDDLGLQLDKCGRVVLTEETE